MFCTKCGTENADGAKFCSSCGNSLEGVQTKGDVADNPVQSELNRGDDDFYGLDKTKTQDEKVENEEKIPWDHVTPKRFLIGIAVVSVIFMIKVGGESPAAITPSSSSASVTQGNDKVLVEVWNGFRHYSGIEGEYVDLKGDLIAKGTVPPSAMNTLVSERLPAYLACYDYIDVTSVGDLKMEMCVYYISNPSRGKYRASWRGPKYMDQLNSMMSDDGFIKS